MTRWQFKDKKFEELIKDSERKRAKEKYDFKYRKLRVFIMCQNCGIEISNSKNIHAKYCSRKCCKNAAVKRHYQIYKNKRNYKILVIEFLGGKCSKCKSSENLEIDHIVAIKNGGAHSIKNVQLLCKKHHMKKTKLDIGI